MRIFLDWLYGDWLPKVKAVSTVDGINIASNLLSFLDKWQCTPQLRSSLLLAVSQARPDLYDVQYDQFVVFAFSLLAHSQDDDAVSVLVAAWPLNPWKQGGANCAYDREFRSESESPASQDAPQPPAKRYLLDPAHMPPKYMQRIPPRYAYALTKMYDRGRVEHLENKPCTCPDWSSRMLKTFQGAVARWDEQHAASGSHMSQSQ